MYQWQNLTLFLAAFGASAVLDQTSNNNLTSIIPAKYLPDRFRAAQDGEVMIQNFIIASVDFLIADSPHARDLVKEALGSELSPSLYSRLFKQLHAYVLFDYGWHDEMLMCSVVSSTISQRRRTSLMMGNSLRKTSSWCSSSR
jgi:hypothetical protein